MNFRKVKYILPLLSVLLFAGCEAEIEEFTPDAGEIDLTTFVTIGNSLTAGYTDNALYRSGQINSVGNILADQLMHAGLQEFKQPLVTDEFGLGGRLMLGVVNGNLLPVPMPGEVDPANLVNIYADEGPFHNMGIPGARTVHLLAPGYGSEQGNPYFARFASSPATTVMDDVLALDPTFFSLWIGSNDILGYALNGGEDLPIPPPAEYELHLSTILGGLTTNGAKGAIGNIVDITSIPFFNVIPYNALVLTDPDIVDALNEAYSVAPHVSFTLGANPFVVEDAAIQPFGFRQLEAGERVLLTAMTGITELNWGSQVFIPAEYYLSNGQLAEIADAVDAYNGIIEDAANQHGLAHVDIRSLMQEANAGIYFDALEFSTTFVTGGTFSLDGIHLSARGSAATANEFIRSINRTYNASIPTAHPGEFDGIIFP
jgi:lysophospholipase L1-like esterase